MSLQFLTLFSTYIFIILCELGDKTQMAVLLLTVNNPARRWLIFAASALALVLCVLIEVTVGVALARHIGPHLINRFTGVIFIVIGLYTLTQHYRLQRRRSDGRLNEEIAEGTSLNSSN